MYCAFCLQNNCLQIAENFTRNPMNGIVAKLKVYLMNYTLFC